MTFSFEIIAVLKLCCKFSYFEIQNFQMISDEKNDQNQSFKSRWELQLCSCWLFYLKSFVVLKLYFKFSQFEIQNFQTASNDEMTKTKVIVLDATTF